MKIDAILLAAKASYVYSIMIKSLGSFSIQILNMIGNIIVVGHARLKTVLPKPYVMMYDTTVRQ